jgi:hypothetical protein
MDFAEKSKAESEQINENSIMSEGNGTKGEIILDTIYYFRK